MPRAFHLLANPLVTNVATRTRPGALSRVSSSALRPAHRCQRIVHHAKRLWGAIISHPTVDLGRYPTVQRERA